MYQAWKFRIWTREFTRPDEMATSPGEMIGPATFFFIIVSQSSICDPILGRTQDNSIPSLYYNPCTSTTRLNSNDLLTANIGTSHRASISQSDVYCFLNECSGWR